MTPQTPAKVTKAKASPSPRKSKSAVPLEKYQTDIQLLWDCLQSMKADKKIDFNAIGETLGLSKAAASKRYSRLGKAVEEWQKGVTKEKNDSEDSEKQPEAKEEMEETDEEVKHEENGQEVNQEEEDA